MIEDKLLMWKFMNGSKEALTLIYKKYVGYLLTLATALTNDLNTAEDIVHDFFVSFAQGPEKLKLDGNLKGYLATCVVNRARDEIRTKQHHSLALSEVNSACSKAKGPELSAICAEELRHLCGAIDHGNLAPAVSRGLKRLRRGFGEQVRCECFADPVRAGRLSLSDRIRQVGHVGGEDRGGYQHLFLCHEGLPTVFSAYAPRKRRRRCGHPASWPAPRRRR